MKIALDAHGGDFGLKPNIEAAIKATKELGVEIILVGRRKEILQELNSHGYNTLPSSIHIYDCKDVIEMSKEAVEECKSKPDSSIMVGTKLVSENKADAFVSAGNSGAVMVASLLNIGRIKGILRPAIAIPFPTEKGYTLLLDAGANMDSRPIHLLQFAIMGSLYMKNWHNIENPKVAILSIGEEETKGNSLVLETIPLLKNCNVINYSGTVEGRDIPTGSADVIVCDGFIGNIVLKLSEGLTKTFLTLIKKEIGNNIINKVGALILKKVFMKIKKKTNPDEVGGAPLIGINGVVLISHGRSSSYAIFNAIKNAKTMCEKRFIEKIRSDIEKAMKSTQLEEV